MNFRNSMLAGAAILFAAGATGCSADLTAPSQIDDAQVNADVAASAGETVASELAGFSDNTAAAGSFTKVAPSYNLTVGPNGGASAQLAPVSSSCSYGAGRYTCSATSENGLSVSRSFAFYDANGGSLQTFDATKVESVNFQAQLDGSFQKDLFWTLGVHRTRNATVSGLISQNPHRVWNGVGSGADTLTHVGLDGVRSLAGKSADTVTNVVMPGAGNYTPLSGTAVVAVDYTASLQGAAGTLSKQVKTRVVVTFDGTQSPVLQLGSLHCLLHLDTHRVDSCQ
jgi:hypothetical protein